ncbi:type IV toxin-antitoxin system AbiEi family antitoxin [Pseudoflavitalea rhizosphaerae]|uniref:type IV toxin-antitoxin system AbiEi family antitoxin n=1 Tax=Pseudoflavitalea rhizosphaerae TaxID=1884793 RepID=UPI000F8EA93A|nr:type IV toxin-antitoxin system AbiEi family antitoxin [Pseudoflavitalea rhizosphaerae]
MIKESAIIEQAVNILRDRTGIKVSWQPYGKAENRVYGIVFQERVMQFVVEYKKYLAAYQVDQIVKTMDFRFPLLVLAEQIAGAAREELRKKGIAYMEANGNIFINNHQAAIFLDGNKPFKETKPVTNRAFTKTGLKAVFHLLNNPEAISKTYRQLAEETGIALGNIKYIIDGLGEAGYIQPLGKRKVALKNKKELLERWVAGYRETLKPDLFKGAFRIPVNEKRDNWQDINVKDLHMEWGGEAAGELITHYLQARVLTLFTPDFTEQQAHQIGLAPDRKGDVLVYNKFWNGNADHISTAPALIVYADLLITDDPRCIQTARLIYEKHLKVKIETDQTIRHPVMQ